jgi:hypothetical protein
MSVKSLQDRELDDYFTALFGMYGTDGWRKILEDMTRLRELYNDAKTIVSDEDRLFRQGQLDIIDQILTHQERTEKGYAHALSEQEGADVEITTGGAAKVVGPDAEDA